MRRKVQLSLVLLLVFLGGCFFWGGKPEGVTDLAKEYAFIKGVLAAPPILERGNERLILYLLVTEPIEEKEDIVKAFAKAIKCISPSLYVTAPDMYMAEEEMRIIAKENGNKSKELLGADYTNSK